MTNSEIKGLKSSQNVPPGCTEVKLPETLNPIWPWRTPGLRLPGCLKDGETLVGVGPMIIYQKRKDPENNKYSPAAGGEENG